MLSPRSHSLKVALTSLIFVALKVLTLTQNLNFVQVLPSDSTLMSPPKLLQICLHIFRPSPFPLGLSSLLALSYEKGLNNFN